MFCFSLSMPLCGLFTNIIKITVGTTYSDRGSASDLLSLSLSPPPQLIFLSIKIMLQDFLYSFRVHTNYCLNLKINPVPEC